MRIYLIGFMGSGKSTAGRRLAHKLGYRFADLDKEVEKLAGMPVPEILVQKGESDFRALEHEALLRTADAVDTVIATGGGTPCFFEHMDWMNRSGVTVYIEMTSAALASRLEGSAAGRPLLAIEGVSLSERITELLAEREPFYRQATITVPGLDLDVDGLGERVKRVS